MIRLRNISQTLLIVLMSAPAILAQPVTPPGPLTPPGSQPPPAPQPTPDIASSWTMWIGLLVVVLVIAIFLLLLSIRRRRNRAKTAATFGPPGFYTSQDPGFTTSPPEPTLPHSSFPSLRASLSALWIRRRRH